MEKHNKILRWIGFITLALFIFTLGIIFYGYINLHKWLILLVSGALVIFFVFIGTLPKNKIKKKIKKLFGL